MRHKKASLFISGILLIIYSLILAVFLINRSVAFILPFIFVSYESFRLFRKIKLIRKGVKEQWRTQLPISNHYYNVWYRFADSTEQEYIAEKFQETIRRIRHK